MTTDGSFAAIQAGQLQTALRPVSTIVNKAVLHGMRDGIHITGVGSAKNTRVTLALAASAFDQYTITDADFGLSIKRLTRCIKLFKSPEVLRLGVGPDKQALHITTDPFDYSLSLLDSENILQSFVSIPDLPATVVMRRDNRRMRRLLTAANLCSSDLLFGIDTASDTFYGRAVGDTDEAYAAFPAEDVLGLVTAPVVVAYPVGTLNDVYRSLPTDSRPLRLALGTEMPLTMVTTVADGHGRVRIDVLPQSKDGPLDERFRRERVGSSHSHGLDDDVVGSEGPATTA